MRFIDLLTLSARKIWHNYTHYILALICIVLTSVLVMTLANFCWYYRANVEKIDLENVNYEGAQISLGRNNSSTVVDMSPVSHSEIMDFAGVAEKLNITDSCLINTSKTFLEEYYYINGERYYVKPYIGRFGSDRKFNFVSGPAWTKDDEGKDYIWLSERDSAEFGVTVGDTLQFKSNMNPVVTLTVKGITDDFYSYVDVKHFTVFSVTVTLNNPEYANYGKIIEVKSAAKSFEKTHKGLRIDGNMIGTAGEEIGWFIYSLLAAIIAIGLGICIVCVLNTLKIAVESDNSTLGLLKALGAKDKHLKLYVVIQVGILIIIGTVIAMLISCLLGYVAINVAMNTVIGMIYGSTAIETLSGFWFVLPLMNIVLLGLVVTLAAIPMLRRYTSLDAIEIINEGNA